MSSARLERDDHCVWACSMVPRRRILGLGADMVGTEDGNGPYSTEVNGLVLTAAVHRSILFLVIAIWKRSDGNKFD